MKHFTILALVAFYSAAVATLHVSLSLTEATVQHKWHYPICPQRPRIAHHRVLRSEWVVGVGGRFECGLLLRGQDNVAAVEVNGRT